MKSLWMSGYTSNRRRPALAGRIDTDTAIVGGGLAGILCARLLKERGIENVVIEAKQIGSGATYHTTGKVTAQHALVYSKIESQYGFEAAEQYYQANQAAVDAYRHLAREIACDFEEKTAYVYSQNHRNKLMQEEALYRRMGIEPTFMENPPIPVSTVGALGMPNQAQFNPAKFLEAAAQDLCIYEDTFASQIQPGFVTTNKGSIHAKRIILATHYPIVNIPGLYFMKQYQSRSYVLALTGAQDPNGMYIDEQEGGFSLRTYGEYLLLGGGGHKTGKKGGGWTALRNKAKEAYPSAQEHYAWAAQDCMTLDAMPYIGIHHSRNRDLYVITGFNKWGMTGCMVGAQLLCDMIAQGASRYAHLLAPSRSMLHPQLFVNMASSVLNLVSPGKRCPHMGCALKWNPQEHTWDCPCHGSRFDQQGHLIDNPALRGLKIE